MTVFPLRPAVDSPNEPAEAPGVRLASIDDLPPAAQLFDEYRQFYGQPADPSLAARFLRERILRDESQLLLAWGASSRPLGFIQLYPSFSSVACRPIYILNDLYVSPGARGKGVARALLQAAVQLGRRRNSARLVLETAQNNKTAQKLYEGFGFVLGNDFLSYSLSLD